uniref:C2H2-type domain-containing protein n=1 Tax=Denticeps clupeoides TaxID=299321 RepID=A0AAY4BYG3_9TELE
MFHGAEHLNSRLQAHDPNRHALQCEECGKLYNTRLGYRRHVATHATAAPGADLACKVCRQAFDSMPALLEHLSTHTGRPPPPPGGAPPRERRHPCDRCDRRFYTRKDVRRHAVVHTGRRDFLCPRCAQRFGRRDHLTRHLKKSHAQEPASLVPAPAGAVKEGPGDAFPMAAYAHQQHPHAASTSGVHHSHRALQQQYVQTPRYQPGPTSYLKTEMESFLAELQCGPPPPPRRAVPASSTRPGDLFPDGLAPDSHFALKNSAFSGAEAPGPANVDISHLLGFLPFGLPPYANAAPPSPQVSGPLPPFQLSPPPPQDLQAPGALNQLPPAFGPRLQQSGFMGCEQL